MDELVEYCEMEHTKQGTIYHLQIVVDGEIVRCKDCKYWDETYFYHSEDDAMQRCICRKHNNIFMTADDFCSRGEKKDE